jgi:flagellar protein FlaI
LLLKNRKQKDFLKTLHRPPQNLLARIICKDDGEEIFSYSLRGIVSIRIIDTGEKTIQCISEPPIESVELENLYTYIDRGERPGNHILSYYYDKILSGVGPLYPLLIDTNVEDIALNNPNSYLMVINRIVGLGWIRSNIYIDGETANLIAKNLAKKAGKPLSPAHPIAEGVLSGGHRIAVSLDKNVSRRGTGFVVRVAMKEPLTLVQLVSKNTLSPLMASYLWYPTEKQGFILIIGGMATGKTTLLQAILNMLPDTHRVVTIEDTPELNLLLENWDSLVTREVFTTTGNAAEIDLYRLAKFALRRRAEHLVIGETRGIEARVLAQAAATGHGSLSTFHADSVRSALYRLMSDPIGLKHGFASLIWAFVQLKLINNSRIVTRIVETLPRGPNRFSLIRVFSWSPDQGFVPSTINDLLKRSYRLSMIGELYGLDPDEIGDELASRMELVSSLSRKKLSSSEMREYLREFYRLRQGLKHDKNG